MCLAVACGPPPAPDDPQPPPDERIEETHRVEESCDSRSSETSEQSSADPCLDGQDFELPLRCTRECDGCGEQRCEVWCTGAGNGARLDLSGCDTERLFADQPFDR